MNHVLRLSPPHVADWQVPTQENSAFSAPSASSAVFRLSGFSAFAGGGAESREGTFWQQACALRAVVSDRV